MVKSRASRLIHSPSGIAALLLVPAVLLSTEVQACPEGWACIEGKACPPVENCVPIAEQTEPVPPAISTPPEELPSSPIEEDPSTPIEEVPSTPIEEVPSTPIEEDPSTTEPIEESPQPDPQPEPQPQPINSSTSEQPGQPPQQPSRNAKDRPEYNTREADSLRERAARSLDMNLEEIQVTAGYQYYGAEKDYGTISSQIGRLRFATEYEAGDDDGDDPRDTPPPVIYGEEIDSVVGIALKRISDRWVPRYGNYTFVIAKMYVPDPAREKVWLPSNSVQRRMEITFVERSNEKGKALNAKLDSDPQDSPDLYFNTTRNAGVECKDDPTGKGHFGTCVTVSEHNEYMFAINSDDFGGFSRLDVSCEGCVPLTLVVGVYPESFVRNQPWTVAVEEPDQQKRAVYVPNDTNKNQISDGYPPDQGVFMSADEDSESIPQGNGVDGDGLSAYEEYRGFFNRHGNHVRTDWNKKTLMIENIHSLSTGKFERASGLEIVELESDGHENRIVNFNSGHANVVAQHGLILRMMASLDDKFAGYCFCDRERPKGANKVAIKPSARNDSGVIAHELGHAVGMAHHGEVAWPETESIRAMTGGFRDLLPGRVHSGPTLCGKALPASFRVGTKGDQGSGNHQCIMKYKHYQYVYEQDGGDYDCMPYTPDSLFDDSPQGTGPNGFNRTAANATLGNCKGQMWISSE